MIEMTIDSIRVSIMNYQRVVILKEKEAERLLPIWIGPAEADSIAVKLQNVEVPRPLTHDLLSSVISTLGATVDSIVVSSLSNDTFYAKLVLRVDGKTLEVDSRPSDAIALAVRTQVPIFAADSVLEAAGVILDKETGQPLIPDEGANPTPRAVSEEEMHRLSAFTDFINELDFGGFDKREEQEKT
jgi:hypothetical protein